MDEGTGSGPAIQVQELRKRFGRTTAVDGLSFEAGWGEVTGFLGPNGAGKTTTLRVLLGVARADSGRALIVGQRYAELEHPTRTVGAVLDASSFHPRRRARDHLRWIAAAGRIDAGAADRVLDTVGLGAHGDAEVRTLSLGMQHRLALAAALLGDPKILILDEPANGLDPSGIRWLRSFLKGFADNGGAVLISSHVLAEVSRIADRVVIVDHGRAVRQGPVDQLLAGRTMTRVRTPDAAGLTRLLVAAGAIVRRAGGDALEVRELDPPRIGAVAARAGIAVHELTSDAATLEDIFFELTGKEADHAAQG